MLIPPPTLVELALSLAVSVLILVAIARFVRTHNLVLPGACQTALASGWAPAAVGIGSALIVLFVWRSAAEPGVIHDEQAYLLQARIFAGGRWTGEPPPIPEFFEQTHVFVEPRLAAKYPPGNSLILVPGIWLGLTGLMPLVLSAAAGGLMFALARRLTDPALALVSCGLWATSTTGLYWRASYYSQTASTVLWLLALWGLLRWTAQFKTRQLAVVACAMAWMYLTRPLTAVALAVPIAVVVLAFTWRRKLWLQIGLATALAVPILLLNPLWQERTTGNWRVSPYTEYTRQYLPFDKPGFGYDPTPPMKPRTPALVGIEQEFIPYHANHQFSSLPVIVTARLVVLVRVFSERWRALFAVFLLLGILVARGPARFGLISGLTLVAAYLAYAHPAWWSLYYTEAFPVFFFLAGLGLMWFVKAMLKLEAAGAQLCLLLVLAATIPWLVTDVLIARRYNDIRSRFHRQAQQALAAIPEVPAVVFVQYPPDHTYYLSLVGNTPDYRTAPVWLVSDRGADNDRLLRLTDRAAYRLHTDTWQLERLR